MVTSDTGTFRNKDIETEDFRYIDFPRPPFSFPEPECWLNDPVEEDRRVGYWSREALCSPTAKFARAAGLAAG